MSLWWEVSLKEFWKSQHITSAGSPSATCLSTPSKNLNLPVSHDFPLKLCWLTEWEVAPLSHHTRSPTLRASTQWIFAFSSIQRSSAPHSFTHQAHKVMLDPLAAKRTASVWGSKKNPEEESRRDMGYHQHSRSLQQEGIILADYRMKPQELECVHLSVHIIKWENDESPTNPWDTAKVLWFLWAAHQSTLQKQI